MRRPHYFLYLWTEIAENSEQKRQFWVKSRSLHDECDDIAGLGSFPAGLFAFSEKECERFISRLRIDMHPLWTITIKRPKLRGSVQSISCSAKMYP